MSFILKKKGKRNYTVLQKKEKKNCVVGFAGCVQETIFFIEKKKSCYVTKDVSIFDESVLLPPLTSPLHFISLAGREHY